MKTPMQQVFYRIEQLRFAKNPIDELMKIRLQMLEKEKEVMCEFADDYQRNCFQKSADDYFKETFKTK